MADSKLKSQSTFWQSMMKKYANQNFKLQEERCNLNQQLKAFDDYLPSDRNKQSLDISNFLSQFDKPDNAAFTYIKNLFYNNNFVAKACAFPVEVRINRCSHDMKNEIRCPCKTCLNGQENISTMRVDGNNSKCKCGSCSSVLKDLCSGNNLNLDELTLNEDGTSLDSVDMLYILKLRELAAREKQMTLRIQELENKEQEYKEILQQADQKWAQMEEHYKEQFVQVRQKEDNARNKFEHLSEQLLEENTKLAEDVKKIKMELFRCMNQVQEPICRQLHEERRKSEMLERELKLTNETFADRQFLYKKGMSDFQEKLNSTCSNMKEITCTNEVLKKEMYSMSSKYEELQEDLRNQQVSESRTLKRLDEALSRINNF